MFIILDLVNYKFLEPLTGHDGIFAGEYVLYKPKTMRSEMEDVSLLVGSHSLENEEPTWLKEIDELEDSRMHAAESPQFDEFEFNVGKSVCL